MSNEKYRSSSSAIANQLIGFSISYQRDNLLARGMGLEHLRELLLRLARPLLRQGASLAYGGHWKETEDNFTFDLLRLISAEQEDNSLAGPDTNLSIGRLYNHSPWPDYLHVTPSMEAQWIKSCRIVRITQKLAGIDDADIVPDAEAKRQLDRVLFNAAITLSAMRRLAMHGIVVDTPDLPTPEPVPPIAARVLLGGKVRGFSGFLPGLFEEALVTLESQRPLYVLGGFGGAGEVLAKALLGKAAERPAEYTLDGLIAGSPALKRLTELSAALALPTGARSSAKALDDLFQLIERARSNLAATLNTGLDDAETRELLTTRDMNRAVQLVRKGLDARIGLTTVAE